MIEQILQADRMLQVDQVDKARDMYRHVVELDPRNAIATVGLARCALAEGDDRGAYELASKALTIDPENDMARRMEARLSEILVTRGVDVARPSVAMSPSQRAMRPVVSPPAGQAAVGRDVTPSGAGPTATEPDSPPPAKTAARKSLMDRLLGR